MTPTDQLRAKAALCRRLAGADHTAHDAHARVLFEQLAYEFEDQAAQIEADDRCWGLMRAHAIFAPQPALA